MLRLVPTADAHEREIAELRSRIIAAVRDHANVSGHALGIVAEAMRREADEWARLAKGPQ